MEERKTMFYCHLCEVKVTKSEQSKRQHINGMRHKRLEEKNKQLFKQVQIPKEEEASNNSVTRSKETAASLNPTLSDTEKPVQQTDENKTSFKAEATTVFEEATVPSSDKSPIESESQLRTQEQQISQSLHKETSPTGKVSDIVSSSASKAKPDTPRNDITSSCTSGMRTAVVSTTLATNVTSATYGAQTKELASKEHVKLSDLTNAHSSSSSINATAETFKTNMIFATASSQPELINSEAAEKHSDILVTHIPGVIRPEKTSCKDEDISRSLVLPWFEVSSPPSDNVLESKSPRAIDKQLTVSSVPNSYSSSDSTSPLASVTNGNVPSPSKHIPESLHSSATHSIHKSNVSSSSDNSVAVASLVTAITSPIMTSEITTGTKHNNPSQSLSSEHAQLSRKEAASKKSSSEVEHNTNSRETPQVSSEQASNTLISSPTGPRTETLTAAEVKGAAEFSSENFPTESGAVTSSCSDKFYTPPGSPVSFRATSDRNENSSITHKASAEVCKNVERTTKSSTPLSTQHPSATSSLSEVQQSVNAEVSAKTSVRAVRADASTQTSPIASVPLSTGQELSETTNTGDKVNSEEAQTENGQLKSECSGDNIDLSREEAKTSSESTSAPHQQLSQGPLPSLAADGMAHAQDFTSGTPTPVKRIALRVVRGPYYQATLHWDAVKKQDTVTSYLVSLTARSSGREWLMDSLPSSSELKVPLRLTAGEDYTARVRAVTGLISQGQTLYETVADTGPVPFRAVYSRHELQLLQGKAEAYMRAHDRGVSAVNNFYRDKPYRYWERVSQNNNIMTAYTKDRHGDQASPINESLAGLFFNVNILKSTGMPPAESLFGDHRLYVPTPYLFGAHHNLYFTDFYCVKYSHYVTLVLAPKDSPSDRLCKELQLPELDKLNNKFLFWSVTGRVFAATATPRVWVEVLYAGGIHLPSHFMNELEHCATVGSGRSNPPGLPKSNTCKVCNIYPLDH